MSSAINSDATCNPDQQEEEEEEEENWVITIAKEIQEDRSLLIHNPSIFMASSPLRSVKHEAFIPQVVALGPYHCELGPHHSSFPINKETVRYKLIAAKEMEKHKVMACRFVSKSFHIDGENGSESLIKEFLNELDKVRIEYDVDLDHKNEKRLAVMLALDASFVVEVLKSNFKSSHRSPNSHRSQSTSSHHANFHSYYCSRFPLPLRKSVLQDFVLLENQIPLFLLLKIISRDKSSQEKEAGSTLSGWIIKLAHEVLPYSLSEGSLSPVSIHNLGKRKHLLDCLYSIVTYEEDGGGSMEKQHQHHHHQQQHQRQCLIEKPTHFPRAVELHNCGIHFKGLETGNMTSVFFDKKKATLHVPKIRVGDDTERLFRNLIAYESHLIDNVHVLSYLRFMNSLVDAPDDVALLVDKGVIAQDIGSNEEVAEMWNNLSMNTMRLCSSQYEQIAIDLVRHCQFRLNALKAEFKRDYLSRPWLAVSVLSAGSLLLMTLIITYYTILLYNKPGG